MSTGTDVEIRGLDELIESFRGAPKDFEASGKQEMQRVAASLKGEMKALVPKYLNKIDSAIAYRVTVESQTAVQARIGPNVTGRAPLHAEVAEGGRGAGKRMPPFGRESKLAAWVRFRGLSEASAFFIARAIGRRGTPTKNNPRTPNPAPVYIERALTNKKAEVDGLGGAMVKVYITRIAGRWR